ncbi:MAG: Amuc_1100 family pilus-like protein [Verrucomicrobiota bacterium]|nr:Amuc_1100 family pilus-like protein [Verrucomicrobiota bacterium]
MSWFRQNRFLGTFLLVVAVAVLAAAYFVWTGKSSFDEAKARFDENAMELNRLQRLTPFPSEPNLRKVKTQADEYVADLGKLKDELKGHVLPLPAEMKPNEFQARLREVVTSLGEKARANRVTLPDNFYLGFEEFAAALPDTAAAPALGQQLTQAEFLMNILLDARVEAVSSFRRVPAAEASLRPPATPAPALPRKPAPGATPAPPTVERSVVETSFLGNPGAVRRALNRISTANEQFYIVRTLHIVNEAEKGPLREDPAAAAPSAPPAAAPGKRPANTALNFIVGNERVRTAARVEMLRFAF